MAIPPEIHWSRADVETVRRPRNRHARAVRGPSAPRRRLEWIVGRSARAAPEARGFARGAFAGAAHIELLRSAQLDRLPGRSLGYFFLAGRNYSVIGPRGGLARETISEIRRQRIPH
jgi:hypothetical protein